MTAAPSLSELPLAMLAPTADEYTIRRGDTVIWHGYFFDYEATVIDVLPATWFAPERLSLCLDSDNAARRWVTVRAECCTILLTRESVEWGREKGKGNE